MFSLDANGIGQTRSAFSLLTTAVGTGRMWRTLHAGQPFTDFQGGNYSFNVILSQRAGYRDTVVSILNEIYIFHLD